MKFKTYLYEAKLKRADLEKPIPGFKNRGEVLLNKIKANRSLTLQNGNEVILFLSKKDLMSLTKMVQKNDFSDINDKIIMQDSNGKIYKLSDLQKTAEFGSSGGSGAGASVTALAESTSAAIAAIFVKNKFKSAKKFLSLIQKIGREGLTKEMQAASSLYNVTDTVEKMVDFLMDNNDWLIGNAYTAEAIMKELKPKNPIFHRGGNFTKELESKVLNMLKDIGLKININKWSPADIWMVDHNSKEVKKLFNSETKTVQTFNEILRKSATGNKSIVGISLKKVGNSFPPLKWFNLSDADGIDPGIDKILPKFFTNLSITKDIFLIDQDDGIKLQIRDFSDSIGGKVQGEIKGKKAAAGKIGFGSIARWFEKNTRSRIKVYKKEDIFDKKRNISDTFIQEMFLIINKLKRKKNVELKGIRKIKSVKDLKNAINDLRISKKNINKTAAALSSKIQALQIALASTDEFFEFVVGFASSNIKGVSAPFLKLGK